MKLKMLVMFLVVISRVLCEVAKLFSVNDTQRKLDCEKETKRRSSLCLIFYILTSEHSLGRLEL